MRPAITSNIIARVFQLRCGNQQGTCFTIDRNGRQYICTAKHCLKDFDGKSLSLWQEGSWKRLDVQLVEFGSSDSDIALLCGDIRLSGPLPIIYSENGMIFGQEVYFLGFPYGLTSGGEETNRSFPLPLVKSGILSGVINENGKTVLFLDGHNNPGFSGGPVIYYRAGKELCVAGIISGYRRVFQHTVQRDRSPAELLYEVNTGIVEAHSIKHAIEAIDSNPVGYPIT